MGNMSVLTIPIQHWTRSASQCKKSRQKTKWALEQGKERTELSLFIGNMIVYVENPNKATKKSSWNYKLNLGMSRDPNQYTHKKTIVFLHISKGLQEVEFKDTTANSIKIVKHLGTDLVKRHKRERPAHRKTGKHGRRRCKTRLDEATCPVYVSEDRGRLRYSFSWNPSVDLMQSPSKSKQFFKRKKHEF